MKKNPHTKWFNLANYKDFEEMSTADWIWQLEARATYRELLHKDPKLVNKQFNILSSLEKTLSISGVIPNYSDCSGLQDMENESILAAQLARYPFSTASVDSLKSYEVWSIMENDQLKRVWDECCNEQDFGWGDPNGIGNKPIDFHIKQDECLDSVRMAHVTINLAATDKQIQNDFKHWLTHYRKEMNYPSETKLFNQTKEKLAYLVKYKVIPYLDLLLVAKIQGKKITYNELGHLLFPDEPTYVDTKDRVEKVTKRLADQITRNELHKTLSTQLAHENMM